MRPTDINALVDIVADAAASGRRLALRGGGTRADIGAPCEASVVDMTGFAGVIDYDPAELVLTAGAGTPLVQIEALLASKNQMLAFEPHGAPDSTLGGVIAAGVSGSRRLSRGAVRDHLLGFKAVSGRGEIFVGGAKVVKNVTGYDLPKLVCGSWGRLVALAELTVKVLPRPPVSLTLAVEGLSPEAAVALMARAMGSQADVAAAACAGGLTALRLEGFGPSVQARRATLQALFPMRVLGEDDANAFWGVLRDPLPDAPVLWRVSAPAGRAPSLLGLGPWLMDWAGGLIWLACDQPEAVRAAADAVGGHAQLARAPEALRRITPALHPQPAGVKALEERVRRAFDPKGVFETGRFLDHNHAD